MAAQASAQKLWVEPDTGVIDGAIEQTMTPFQQSAGDINSIRDRLLDLMWEGVGVLRDANGIQQAQTELAALKTELLATGLGDENRV